MKFVLFLMLTGAVSIAASTPKDVAKRAEDVRPLPVGVQVPDGKVRTIKGKTVSMAQLLGRSPTVLMFYRGGWCPYCNVHMGELAKLEGELKKLGVQILALSPDRPEKLKESLKKNKVSYTLLSDSDLSFSRKMGLVFALDEKTKKRYKEYGIDLKGDSGKAHGWLPVPAVFLVDTQRNIQFQYVNPNYKVRLKGELLMAAVRSVLAKP